MQRTLGLVLSVVIVFGVLMLGGIRPSSSVQAESLLQGVPILTGYKIYFTEDNGEANRFDRGAGGISRLAGLLRLLGAELYTLDWRSNFPEDADLVVVAGLTSDLGANQTARLWTYLDKDGSLLVLADPVTGSGRNTQGIGSGAGIFTLLWTDVGIRLRDDAVVTENTSGSGGAPLMVAFETASFDSDHPITAGASGAVRFEQARSVEIDSSLQTFIVTPLILSPDGFYGEVNYNDYLQTDLAAYNIGDDITRGEQVLAVAAEDPATNVRIALIGDRDFPLNGGGLQTSPPTSAAFVYPENARFLLRLIAWLVKADPSNEYVFEFATPGPTATATITPTPVIANADLTLSITASTNTPHEGEAVVYEITMTNNGPDTATALSVSSVLPPDLTFVSATASTRRGYNFESGIWDAGDLAEGASATLTIVVQVNPETTGKVVPLTAEIVISEAIIDSNMGDNQATAEVIVTAEAGS